uniref:Odorant receptor n=1 Tax=Lutzomyia longipalpis TaxID=7200 RepID=A0A3F2ZDB6_LUTLO
MEEFNKKWSRINFLLSHMTVNITTGSLKDRLVISVVAMVNVLFFVCLFLHLWNSEFALNFNILVSGLTFFGCAHYLFRLAVGFFKVDLYTELMQKIKALYTEKGDDEEDEQILAKHLMNSLKIFSLIDKCFSVLYVLAGMMTGVYFRYNPDYGLMIDLPFISLDIFQGNFLWREFPYFIQEYFYTSFGVTVIILDLGIIFMGIQVIAELNILTDSMNLLNEKIKTHPMFLHRIIRRHCSLIENINLLNDIIAESSFVQLMLTFATILFGMTFLITYTTGYVNYIIVCGSGGIGLSICILGEFIRNKTESLSDTLYMTNWYDLSAKDQKIFLIMLGMAQRGYGLKSAGMYDINLYTFVQIFKIAFSYSAVLYSLSN